MSSRAVMLWLVTSLLVAGCGGAGTTHHLGPARPEVFESNQRVITLVRLARRTVAGTPFLVPADLDATSVDFIRPASINVTPSPPFATRSTPPGLDASVTGVIARPSRVEVVATGPLGRQVDVAWEETCGFHRSGPGPGESGGVGGRGGQRARLPTVVAIRLPNWSSGEDSCYVAATLSTNHFERGLHIQLVNF